MKVELWSMPSGAVRAPLEELDLGVGELNLHSSVAGGSDDGGPPGEAGRPSGGVRRRRAVHLGSRAPTGEDGAPLVVRWETPNDRVGAPFSTRRRRGRRGGNRA
jgi:hypothetical protein